MKAIEYIAFAVCIVNMMAFYGIWEMVIFWGFLAVIPLTMIIYQKLKEKNGGV